MNVEATYFRGSEAGQQDMKIVIHHTSNGQSSKRSNCRISLDGQSMVSSMIGVMPAAGRRMSNVPGEFSQKNMYNMSPQLKEYTKSGTPIHRDKFLVPNSFNFLVKKTSGDSMAQDLDPAFKK